MATKITIVGCGPGGVDYLLPAAAHAVANADAIAGAERLFTLFPEFEGDRIKLEKSIDKLLDAVENHNGHVAVLVSGDPGLFSLSIHVQKRFSNMKINIVPGISSVQAAFARIGLTHTDAHIISAHAALPECNTEQLVNYPKLAILGGNQKSTPWIVSAIKNLHDTHRIYICQDITLPSEKITEAAKEITEDMIKGSRILILCHSK